MEFLRKHADSISVIAVVAAAVWWMTSQINGLENRFDQKLVLMENRIDDRMVSLEKDIAVIKAVLIMKGNMPKELAIQKEIK